MSNSKIVGTPIDFLYHEYGPYERIQRFADTELSDVETGMVKHYEIYGKDIFVAITDKRHDHPNTDQNGIYLELVVSNNATIHLNGVKMEGPEHYRIYIPMKWEDGYWVAVHPAVTVLIDGEWLIPKKKKEVTETPIWPLVEAWEADMEEQLRNQFKV